MRRSEMEENVKHGDQNGDEKKMKLEESMTKRKLR